MLSDEATRLGDGYCIDKELDSEAALIVGLWRAGSKNLANKEPEDDMRRNIKAAFVRTYTKHLKDTNPNKGRELRYMIQTMRAREVSKLKKYADKTNTNPYWR